MFPIAIIPNKPINYEYCGDIFFYLMNLNYDITIDSDFDGLIENKLKFYEKYFIIKVNDNDIDILYKNEVTVLQKNNPLIGEQLEKLINIHLKLIN